MEIAVLLLVELGALGNVEHQLLVLVDVKVMLVKADVVNNVHHAIANVLVNAQLVVLGGAIIAVHLLVLEVVLLVPLHVLLAGPVVQIQGAVQRHAKQDAMDTQVAINYKIYRKELNDK